MSAAFLLKAGLGAVNDRIDLCKYGVVVHICINIYAEVST